MSEIDEATLDAELDRTHRVVESRHASTSRFACLDCEATAYNRPPAPPCPGATT